MTIETTTFDRSSPTLELPREVTVHITPVGAPAAASAQHAPESLSPDAVTAAVQQLQEAISRGPNPDFKLDYLSGLSVVTVRSSLTGEVVFQLPDTRAVELARLIKGGASVGSVGLFSTTA